MRFWLRRLLRSRPAASTVEFALIVALLTLTAAAGLLLLGSRVATLLSGMGQRL